MSPGSGSAWCTRARGGTGSRTTVGVLGARAEAGAGVCVDDGQLRHADKRRLYAGWRLPDTAICIGAGDDAGDCT